MPSTGSAASSTPTDTTSTGPSAVSARMFCQFRSGAPPPADAAGGGSTRARSLRRSRPHEARARRRGFQRRRCPALSDQEGARQLRQHARARERLDRIGLGKKRVDSTLLPGVEDDADAIGDLLRRVVVGGQAEPNPR